MSRTACSGSAVESTIMALRPPVSAISGAPGARWSAMAASMALAVGERAGEDDAVDARIGGERGADDLAGAGEQLDHVLGDAGLVHQLRRRGRRSAAWLRRGLASTVLPVTSAAAIWPVKIASGKFHGEMAVTMPSGGAPRARPRPRRRSSGGNRRPRALRRRRRPGSCRPRGRRARRARWRSARRGRRPGGAAGRARRPDGRPSRGRRRGHWRWRGRWSAGRRRWLRRRGCRWRGSRCGNARPASPCTCAMEAADQSLVALANSCRSASSFSTATGSVRSKPAELVRAGAKRSARGLDAGDGGFDGVERDRRPPARRARRGRRSG